MSVTLSKHEQRMLRQARRSAGMSMRETAAAANISRYAYRKFERGEGSVEPEAWDRIATAVGISADMNAYSAGAHIGETIRAARIQRGWSRQEVEQRMNAIRPGNEWTAWRLQQLERGKIAWPLEGCAALARVLGVAPEDVGLETLPPVLRMLHASIWSVYYHNPSDLVEIGALVSLDPAALCTSIDGLRVMQAIGVSMRDAGHELQAWNMLNVVASHAAAHEDAPDVLTAAHMRLARAALDANRTRGGSWADTAADHAMKSLREIARCRPRLQAVALLTAGETLAAQGSFDQASEMLRESRRIARLHPGRDDETGVIAHETGVMHAIVRCLTPLVQHGDTTQRTMLQRHLCDLQIAVRDPALPRRWKADIYASIASAWLALGQIESAMHGCSLAVAEMHSAHSPKLKKNVQRAIAQLPASDDRNALINAIGGCC